MNLKFPMRWILTMLVACLLVAAIWRPGKASQVVLRADYVHPLMTLNCDVETIDPAQQPDRLSRPQPAYQPKQVIALAHSTNFGERYARNTKGQLVNNQPIVVLHETVGSTFGTINFFQTPHPNDADQASYHSLISLEGTIYYLVPPENRAYGAGNSVFKSAKGEEAVQTNPKLRPSVNNFAYHISLETPPGGMHNGRRHEGYTNAQYQSLAWLVAKTGIPDDRITTHKAVDRSNSRMDPRSFSQQKFQKLLDSYDRRDEIGLTCLARLAERTELPHLLPDMGDANFSR